MRSKARPTQRVEDIDKPVEDVNAEGDSEEEDAPEAVTWTASKELVLKEIEKEKESISNTRKREKQVRIHKEERSRQLKEERKAKELSRLPQEILQKVAAQQEAEDKSKETQETTQSLGEHVTFDSDSDSDLDMSEKMLQASDSVHGLNVLVLAKEARKPKKIQTSASDFLQQQLYGDRLQRVPTLKAMNYKRKGRSQKPAIKFAKKM